MGGFSSHHVQDEDDSMQQCTPVRGCHGFKRTLDEDWDPRSPATEFARTPIQVQATPECVNDPRSPSNEITRTPIYGIQDKADVHRELNLVKQNISLDLSGTDRVDASVMTLASTDNIHCSMLTDTPNKMAAAAAHDVSMQSTQGDDVTDPVEEGDTSSPDPTVEDDDITDPLEIDPTPTSVESFPQMSTVNPSLLLPLSVEIPQDDPRPLKDDLNELKSDSAESNPTLRQRNVASRLMADQPVTESTNQNAPSVASDMSNSQSQKASHQVYEDKEPSPVRSPMKVKAPSNSVPRSPLKSKAFSSSDSVQRSPLSSRNTDSPRVLVQKKQISRVQRQLKAKGRRGGHQGQHVVYDDKENL